MKRNVIMRLTCALLASLTAFSFFGCNKGYKLPEYAQVYETTGTKSKLLARQSDIKFSDYSESMNVTVTVDPFQVKHDYYGNGAAMTHSSAYMLMQADAQTRTEILKEFFAPEGARFTNIRLPIGASDYIPEKEHFTCDDIDLKTNPDNTDVNLERFSLEHDQDIIAVLKEVVAINPNIDIIACPWSAPAWMKNRKSLYGGSLEDKYVDVFADYLIKFVDEYAKEGINITWISPINEPRISSVGYPHMQMTPEQMAQVIISLGKKLKARNSNVKLMAYDHNYNSSSDVIVQMYVDAIFNSEAKDYLSAISFHTYAGEFNKTLQYAFELFGEYDCELFLTETTEYDGSVDFASNLSYALKNVILTPTAYGSAMGLYWNYVLTYDGKPVRGNDATCFGLISLDLEGDKWVYSKYPAYYAMAHVSSFVYEIDGKLPKVVSAESSNETKITASAFMRADGRLVVVVANTNDATYEDVDVVVGKKCVTYRILPQSVVTLVM